MVISGVTPYGHAEGVVAVLASAEQRRSVAFAMGLQERLGAASLLRGLDPELVRMVVELVPRSRASVPPPRAYRVIVEN